MFTPATWCRVVRSRDFSAPKLRAASYRLIFQNIQGLMRPQRMRTRVTQLITINLLQTNVLIIVIAVATISNVPYI